MSSLETEDYLMISGLQHWMFCKRQCGLIHLEQCWAENKLTLEGQHLHQRADEGSSESRGNIRVERGVALISHRLKLIGRADVVEFHQNSQTKAWRPFPVEYKRGRPKEGLEDKVQLCAQAMCLEEQLNCEIPSGALFYGRQRRRLEVMFDVTLREETFAAAEGFHALLYSQALPPPESGPKCAQCSLKEICLPQTQGLDVKSYLARGGESLT